METDGKKILKKTTDTLWKQLTVKKNYKIKISVMVLFG